MKTSDFDYHLPPELIAQTPIEPRDQSRLLVVERKHGTLRHARFSDLPGLLRPGDLLVCNDSRVIPARLLGRKADTGGKVEFLLLRRVEPSTWEVLLKPSRRLRPGTPFRLVVDPDCSTASTNGSNLAGATLIEGEVVDRSADGTWLIRFTREPDVDRLGRVPLPPYVRQSLADPERYQTVYACARGSVAAPTAGLHFTPQLMRNLTSCGIKQAFLTVHIGLDTFRPVAVEDPTAHPIHTEWGELTAATADQVNGAKLAGGRVIAVGTSATRLLETAAGPDRVNPFVGPTSLFILPGHRFRTVDALITNFHLPRTTLLMLVSAFAGQDLVRAAYDEAVRKRYRFYSFGDAMLIL